MKKWFFLSLVLLLSLPGQASARHGQPGRWHTSFEIGPDGDTISVVPIKPVFVFSKKADLRRYRKLVEAVKKVYPVAQAAKAQMVQMEAELLRLETKKEQKQYIKGIAAAIKKEYTPVLKHMTRTQGRVLLKLIDRKRNTRLTKSSGSSGAASSRDSGKAYRVSSDRISSRNTTAKGTTRCSNRSFSITKRGCCKPHPHPQHRLKEAACRLRRTAPRPVPPFLTSAHSSISPLCFLGGQHSFCFSAFADLSLSMMDDFSPLSGALTSAVLPSFGPLLMIPSIMP